MALPSSPTCPTSLQTSRCAGSDTYVIFGEAKVEDQNAGLAQQLQAMQAMAQAQQAGGMGKVGAGAEEEAGGDEDATGLDEKDINLVMEQTSVSRAKAIAALKKNDKDIVNAIMELTSA